MRRLTYILLLVCLPGLLAAQVKQQIKGKVVAESDGLPLPGATVGIQGDSVKMTTLGDGSFQLQTTESRVVIVVSYLGYQRQEIVLELPQKEGLTVALKEDAYALKEVTVSTGYEEVRKERVTGSFEKVSPELINRSSGTDILSRIESLVPSVFFDKRNFNINGSLNNSSLIIRGMSTINANSQPLIVLDNFPYEGDIQQINPNDVEDITILKDASAASIWGARAGNGVIVITTKKGRFNQPIKIGFNTNVNITGKPDLFAYPQISSSDFIDAEQFLFSKGYYQSMENSTRKPALSPVIELLIAKRDGKLPAAEVDSRINGMKGWDVRHDFDRYLYRQAVSQAYSMNLSGGGPMHNFILSGGYDRDFQSLITNTSNRVTLRAENVVKPIKNLEVQGRIMYSSSERSRNNSSSGVGFGLIRQGARNLYPYARLADENGNALPVDKDFRSSFTGTLGNGQLLDWQYRPLDEARMADNINRSRDLLLTAGVKYTLAGWLNAEAKYQFQTTSDKGQDHYAVDSYYARNLINRYTQITGAQVVRPIPVGGVLDLSEGLLTSNAVRGQLKLNKHVGDKHQLTGLLGAEVRENRNKASMYRTYGYSDDRLTYANVDFLTVFPAYSNLAAASTIPNESSFSELTDRFVSVYGNGSYSFDSRYIVSLSARKDASNLFGVRTNQKGVPLWSIGGAWNVSHEDFYKVPGLPLLKLRASYGYGGNVDNSRSAYTTMSYFPGPNNVNNLTYGNLVNPPNEQLRWEKVRTLNTGVDFAIKENRITGSFDYYQKRTTDLLGLAPFDPTTGFATMTLNSASTKGRGFELQLQAENIRGRVNWTSNFLLAHNKTVVDRYLSSPTTSNSTVTSGISINPIEGYMLYPVFSYRWAGLDGATGDPKGFVNGAESKDYSSIVSRTPVGELVYHGSAIPLYFGSLRNTLAWKDLSLSANISFKFAYYFRRASINYSSLMNSGTGHPDYALRWQKPGDESFTSVPAMVYPANSSRDAFYNNSELTVEKGDHVRLQDIRLSYNLRKEQFKGLPARQIQLFLYTHNTGLLWTANKRGLDPDYGFNGIPPSRTVAGGVRVDF